MRMPFFLPDNELDEKCGHSVWSIPEEEDASVRKIIRRETKELGELRTSQLITSFGVGAIVDFRDETAILGGADDWYRNPEEDKARVLRCHNLEKILDKQFFVKPKCDKKQRAIYKRSYSHDIGAYRFPSVLYCPSCTHLWSEKELAGLQKGELRCPRCGKRPCTFAIYRGMQTWSY